MKKLVSIFSAMALCISFSSCGHSFTEEERKIYEALMDGDYSYEKYGDVIACSNIYSYSDRKDENDEQHPFLMLDMDNKVDSYCYIDFADDEEDVCVLVLEGSYKGKVCTYFQSAEESALLLVNTDFDLFQQMFPNAVSNFDNLDEVLKNQFTLYGYKLFYVPDDSTINTKLISNILKSEMIE